MKPWVGEEYQEEKLLILGESSYSWEKYGEVMIPSEDHCTQLVKWAIEDFEGCRADKMRFLVLVSRALCGTENPDSTQISRAWNEVAFVNFVPEPVQLGSRRPTEAMWRKAAENFKPLLEELKPKNTIVLGKESWSWLPSTDYYVTADVQGYRIQSENYISMCWVVKHPSRSNWKQLSQTIKFVRGCSYDI